MSDGETVDLVVRGLTRDEMDQVADGSVPDSVIGKLVDTAATRASVLLDHEKQARALNARRKRDGLPCLVEESASDPLRLNIGAAEFAAAVGAPDVHAALADVRALGANATRLRPACEPEPRAEEVPDDHPARDLPFGHPLREVMGVGNEDLTPIEPEPSPEAVEHVRKWFSRRFGSELLPEGAHDLLSGLPGVVSAEEHAALRAALEDVQAKHATTAELLAAVEEDRDKQRERAERAEAERDRLRERLNVARREFDAADEGSP